MKAEKKRDVFGQLMRTMGSPTGDWHPTPDTHISGNLREDVQPTASETKSINYVNGCCLLQKPGGRTEWGKTEEGEPCVLARIADRLFNGDVSNAAKAVKRPLAWGFIRCNKEGVFGTGASVTGTALIQPDLPAEGEGETKAKLLNQLVCTYHLPVYVATHFKGLSEIEVKRFATGWVSRVELRKQQLADAAAIIREQEFKDLNGLCEEFGTSLKTVKKEEQKRKPSVQLSFLPETDFHRSVHTTKKTKSVQTRKGGVYKAKARSVQTDASLLDSFEESELEELIKAGPEENVNSTPIKEAIRETLARPRLRTLDGKPLEEKTVDNIARHLLRLPEERSVKEVLDVLEEVARDLASHPTKASGKTWGYLTGVVKRQVNDRVGEVPERKSAGQEERDNADDLKEQFRTTAAGKGMR